ncbi:hypothetical protein MtrunA17_Chr1g0201411 [Medicago truncatula]|uniref:Uncharacterized protein n=1 Tax=Medicago truncatula TaxID=3880 RepID=A0A396JTJ6_MEDTR|nr:hypothetical protein MtrunA17_Chr1g0201411 [Medicago truncatula]
MNDNIYTRLKYIAQELMIAPFNLLQQSFINGPKKSSRYVR